MDDIFIGRQPIYDRNLFVYAYELLFREDTSNAAEFSDGEQATYEVILNTFMEIGLNNIVSKRLAFINLTRSFFVQKHSVSLPKDRVVLELLEDIEIDDQVIEGVKRLKNEGYKIALDDFVYHESLQELAELADFIKIDVVALDHQQIREHVQRLRALPARLLAEKIESVETFNLCMQLGFDYFQGYYFSQPEVFHRQRLPNNRLTILKLISELQDPGTTSTQIEAIVAQDAFFSDRIVQYVNSAAFALERKIESVQEARIILGIQTIRSLATLLAMTRIDNKPNELVITAITRAKMAECMANKLKLENPGAFFMSGLFSALDVLMDNTMEEILTQLALPSPVSDALLHHSGPCGSILACVLAYERGNWQQIRCEKLSRMDIANCYLSAIRSAAEIASHLIDERSKTDH